MVRLGGEFDYKMLGSYIGEFEQCFVEIALKKISKNKSKHDPNYRKPIHARGLGWSHLPILDTPDAEKSKEDECLSMVF